MIKCDDCGVCHANSKAAHVTDFQIANHGSIVVLTPVTADAQAWVDEHILVEGNEVQTWGKGIVVEPRYLGNIIEGFSAEGLTA